MVNQHKQFIQELSKATDKDLTIIPNNSTNPYQSAEEIPTNKESFDKQFKIIDTKKCHYNMPLINYTRYHWKHQILKPHIFNILKNQPYILYSQ